MTVQHDTPLEPSSEALDPLTYGVSVVDGRTVQVSGMSAQQMIELLLSTGSQVIVAGTADLQRADRYAAVALSEREAEILTLITTGLSNVEIADRMFLSVNTIKSYIRSTYRKIGASTRTQAALWALRNGVADDS